MRKFTMVVATTEKDIVLIKKESPDWQKGRFNFISGHFEIGEPGRVCMARSFFEETGISMPVDSWEYVGKFWRPDDFECIVYTQENEKFNGVKTITVEEIILKNKIEFVAEALAYPERFMSNTLWTYLFTQSEDFKEYSCDIELRFAKIKSAANGADAK